MRIRLARVSMAAVLVIICASAQACESGSGQPSSTASPSPTASNTAAAVQAVIQKADQEQQQAFAQDKPTLMRNTATAAYYAQLVNTDTMLRNAGVTAIKLRSETFGQVTVQAGSAQATATETWQATYTGGSTQVETSVNIYQLVLSSSGWKIKSDTLPHTNIPPSGPSPGATPTSNPSPGGSSGTVGSTSRNWSGYVATGSGFTAVRGTWTVPTVSANASGGGVDATWVGIGGATTTDLVQAGTQSIVESGGVVQYSAWIETLPQPSQPVPLTVNAGDSMTVSLTAQPNNVWSISIVDTTSGGSYTGTVSYTSSESSTEWIEEAPTSGRTVVKLDQFGTIQFTNATVVRGGQTLTAGQAGATAVTMINGAGVRLATPSGLGASGSSFSVTRT